MLPLSFHLRQRLSVRFNNNSRRDGFTSVEAMLSGQPGTLTTRPIVWAGGKHFLFVNVVIQPGGFLQVRAVEPQGKAEKQKEKQ
eukprot:SAG22_NODE_180_length_16069_cov_5.323231_4_plen_84_part_00